MHIQHDRGPYRLILSSTAGGSVICPGEGEFIYGDGKPVYIVVLLVSPIDRTGPHIQALARISRLMLDEDFKNKLQNAPSAEKLYELIREKEAE